MPDKKMDKIKNEEQYEALRDKGMKKEKAARIANTENPDYNSTPYEERSRNQLYQLAKKLEIPGRSKMDKDQLIKVLRKQ